MKIFDKRTLFVLAVVTPMNVWAAGPGTYLGIGANSPPGGNTTTQISGGTGGATIGATQSAPSPNSRALETANGQFADRQIGLERAREQLSFQGLEQQRAAQELESRARSTARRSAPSAAAVVTEPAGTPIIQ